MAIYERWNEVKVSDAAKRLEVSTESASRCFDAVSYTHLDVYKRQANMFILMYL